MKGFKNQHEWGVIGQCRQPYREFAYCPLCNQYREHSKDRIKPGQFKKLVIALAQTDNPMYDADSDTLYLDGRGRHWNIKTTELTCKLTQ